MGAYDGNGTPIEFNARFPGQWADEESNLSHNLHRYYDGQRYISSDPIGLQGGLSTFLYAGSNPVRFSDPSGLCYSCLVAVTK